MNNNKFNFESLEESITEGYQMLKEMYRMFYKRIKNTCDHIYYIKIYEPHSSLIPHLHCVLHIPKDKKEVVKKTFFEIKKEFHLSRVDYDESIYADDIKNVNAYVMKYILKSYKSKNEFQNRMTDGWRRKYKIRALETSKLQLSVEVYKKLYYNLPPTEKESIQKIIEANNQSFFEYFIKNTLVTQTIYKEDEM